MRAILVIVLADAAVAHGVANLGAGEH